MTCPICQSFLCDDPGDSLYSLDSDVFPWVLFCPSGYDCKAAKEFNIQCCDQWIKITWTDDTTDSQLKTLFTNALNACAVRNSFCTVENDLNDPPPDTPPNTIYRNAPQSCTAVCSDGLPFTVTIPAGFFGAVSQLAADNLAHQYACKLANDRKVCLSALSVTKTCKSASYSATITASGNSVMHGGNVWSIIAGALPTGLSISSTGDNTLRITGTPTNSGSFSFTVKVLAPNGDFQTKSYTLCVVVITPTTLDNGHISTPYSQTLTANCVTDSESWQVTSGHLPPGLTLNEATGVISGTPTVNGTFNFTVTYQSPAT